jgi:hypothetical protein
MTRAELRRIVTRQGGVTAFAAKLKVSRRAVQYWLAGKRKLRPVIEDRIRQIDVDQPTLSRNATVSD